MTVGRVYDMSFTTPALQPGSPAMRYTAGNVPSTTAASKFDQDVKSLFFNYDGDTAEISNKAKGLSDTQPPRQSAGPESILNYQFTNLPSPILDWGNLTFVPPIRPSSENLPAPDKQNAPPKDAQIPEAQASDLLKAVEPKGKCQTCSNRKYVDQSNDSSVSYQTPTNISPNMAAGAVASHENEHARNEQAKAERDGRETVSQTVTLTYDVCPECGRSYVSGGTTRTTSVDKNEKDETEASSNEDTSSDRSDVA